jgi:hypothetical protein
MPPKGERPDVPLNAHQMELVIIAAAEFALTGAVEVAVCRRLYEAGIDVRDIIDGCMSNPTYKPTFH